MKLHGVYNIADIDKVVEEEDLFEKVNGILEPMSDDMPDGEIGEIILPLYFEDGTVALNFILIGYGTSSSWRCIYVCPRLDD